MLRFVVLMALFWFSFASAAYSRTIIDMDGRTVQVPTPTSPKQDFQSVSGNSSFFPPREL